MGKTKRRGGENKEHLRVPEVIVSPYPSAKASVGDQGVVVAVSNGQAEGGIGAAAIVGVKGTASVGKYGIAVCGDGGKATAIWDGYAIAYDDGNATILSGDGGVAIARARTRVSKISHGNAEACGKQGIAITQHRGSARVGGAGGIAISMDKGSVQGVTGCLLIAKYMVSTAKGEEDRFAVGIVGQDGLKSDISYVADGKGWFKVAPKRS